MEGDVITLTQDIGLCLWARMEAFLRPIILDLTGAARALPDGRAIEFGETRLSVWLVEAFIVIGTLFALARFGSNTSATRVRLLDGPG